jgi:hypothetical protein
MIIILKNDLIKEYIFVLTIEINFSFRDFTYPLYHCKPLTYKRNSNDQSKKNKLVHF